MSESKASSSDPRPMVSVIIPCRNDGKTLGKVLSALEKQTYPSDRLEIIVVDNGSSDASAEVAENHSVILLHESYTSSYAARNRGIEAGQGDWLLFLDADTVPQEEWVEEMIKTARQENAQLVGGRIENEVTRFSLGSALLACTRTAEHRKDMVITHGRCSGGNMLAARSLFNKYGLFLPVKSGGDGEFSERVNPEKEPVPYADNAVVVHHCEISTIDYLCRACRIAYGQTITGAENFKHSACGLWRPGLRRAKEFRQKLEESYPGPWGCVLTLRIMAVLWLERGFFFIGVCAGQIRARRRA